LWHNHPLLCMQFIYLTPSKSVFIGHLRWFLTAFVAHLFNIAIKNAPHLALSNP
jgi:hypothetical protein